MYLCAWLMLLCGLPGWSIESNRPHCPGGVFSIVSPVWKGHVDIARLLGVNRSLMYVQFLMCNFAILYLAAVTLPTTHTRRKAEEIEHSVQTRRHECRTRAWRTAHQYSV